MLDQPLESSRPLEHVRATIREHVAFMASDRYIHPDLEAARRLVREGRIVAAADGIDFPVLSDE